MTGVPFRVDGKGRVIVSWMSQHKAYWTISSNNATWFAPRISTPDTTGQENFPIVLTNRKSEVLLVWKQGSQVNWARYTMGGMFTGARGTVGTLSGRNKPTAFVGADGEFYVEL
jgi:hypothetical protein